MPHARHAAHRRTTFRPPAAAAVLTAVLAGALCGAVDPALAQSPNTNGVPGTPGAAAPTTVDGRGGAAGSVDKAALQEFAASKAGARAERAEARSEPDILCDDCARVTSVRSESRRLAGNQLGASGTRRRTVWITTVRLKDGASRSFETDADPSMKAGEVVKVDGPAISRTR